MVELLVVMTIIAILVGISLVSFDAIRKSARDGKRKADLESIRSALEIYRTDCRSYPATGDFNIGVTATLTGPAAPCADIVYLAIVPNDPISSSKYFYVKGATNNTYSLCAHLESGTSSTVSDCGSNCGTNGDCNYGVYNP